MPTIPPKIANVMTKKMALYLAGGLAALGFALLRYLVLNKGIYELGRLVYGLEVGSVPVDSEWG
ncbi:hypothetical protein OFW50_01530 [Lacticaseibacillus chiayiensis]|uniref:Uncharacterized protein n=1 Tax=Lacticaseibacillus chiayiensis TaxID=2100821 RepID=A0ABY6H622_9LACO|nr:hypothetical protein [Lacticaseibacillus chiayiensis]UYN56811.1 hypothetical protein OFW50_01530 [Lacticaseibacillus chiayiensis]